MALTERTEQTLIVSPNGSIRVRDEMVIERDGKEINRSFHSKVIDVDDDISKESDRVKSVISGDIWTQEVKNSHKAKKELVNTIK